MLEERRQLIEELIASKESEHVESIAQAKVQLLECSTWSPILGLVFVSIMVLYMPMISYNVLTFAASSTTRAAETTQCEKCQ